MEEHDIGIMSFILLLLHGVYISFFWCQWSNLITYGQKILLNHYWTLFTSDWTKHVHEVQIFWLKKLSRYHLIVSVILLKLSCVNTNAYCPALLNNIDCTSWQCYLSNRLGALTGPHFVTRSLTLMLGCTIWNPVLRDLPFGQQQWTAPSD